MTREKARLDEARDKSAAWRKWGPYLSERQWGTVREDYSEAGSAWDYFTHDQARYRAYRWGEDGLAGFSDDKQRLCFGLALWNGADPILKERLFGLSNSEGNHGEDVKEYYYYLDSTPTHSYTKFLYKYPQKAYPYETIVRTNKQRSRFEPEFELIDTGIFGENRYFDVFVEYAKAAPEDILIRITIENRGPEAATLHVLPLLWFRNTWNGSEGNGKPVVRATERGPVTGVAAAHLDLGVRYLYCEGSPPLLFTENETNTEKLSGTPNRTPYVKDGIEAFVVAGRTGAVNPDRTGTKVAAHYPLSIEAGGSATLRLRLTDVAPSALKKSYAEAEGSPFGRFDFTVDTRLAEANEFYHSITPPKISPDAAMVMRQALAGMLWTKQYFYYDVTQWLSEHGINPQKDKRPCRNREWYHMFNDDIISMPDKWEYPWYAAWDLAFHCIPLATVDPDFAKAQLDLMLRERYMHPNGQIPAYEWNFGDVNPPVHAWAVWFTYSADKESHGGQGDVAFLKYAFQKLLMNFTWWVNRKDVEGNNLFSGGFLGLDNIGVFDRSAPLPTGGHLEQSDGTAWMAFYCTCMLDIAVELSLHDPVYEDMALKFLEHFLWIAAAMDKIGERHDELWDEEDGFFYDVLHFPQGGGVRIKVRSLVGLMPICAVTVFSEESFERLPGLVERGRRFLDRNPEMLETIASPRVPGKHGRRLLAVCDERKLRRLLTRMLDEQEFLSDFGIRSLSLVHKDNPYTFTVGNDVYKVPYEPGESTTGMFGGNSNWRGPIWMPMNALLIRSLLMHYQYYGDDFTVECPTGSGQHMTLFQVAEELSRRLSRIFMLDENGCRPVFGANETLQKDPHWRDHILFFEYFHGDTGAGIGASHQTGWTGLIAKLIEFFGRITAADVLGAGGGAVLARDEEKKARRRKAG